MNNIKPGLPSSLCLIKILPLRFFPLLLCRLRVEKKFITIRNKKGTAALF